MSVLKQKINGVWEHVYTLLDLPDASVPESKINGLTTDLASKQNKTDNALTTTAKTIVGAINEIAAWISTNATNILNHLTNKNNPHEVNAGQVGYNDATTYQSGTVGAELTDHSEAIVTLGQNKLDKRSTGTEVYAHEGSEQKGYPVETATELPVTIETWTFTLEDDTTVTKKVIINA